MRAAASHDEADRFYVQRINSIKHRSADMAASRQRRKIPRGFQETMDSALVTAKMKLTLRGQSAVAVIHRI